MSVVVSDTSPLHYLILCETEEILPKLFQQVVIPPTVFQELQQPNTPSPVKRWAGSLPPWATVRKPTSLNLKLAVDAGELEALCLAQETAVNKMAHPSHDSSLPRRTPGVAFDEPACALNAGLCYNWCPDPDFNAADCVFVRQKLTPT